MDRKPAEADNTQFIDLYSVDGWVNTWYDKNNNVVRVKWLNYTSRIHLRRSCEAQLDAMEKYGSKIILADAYDAIGHPYPQDQEWFITHLYPRSIALGLRVIVSVLPKNIIARTGAQSWINTARDNGLSYIEVSSIEEAEQELKKLVTEKTTHNVCVNGQRII